LHRAWCITQDGRLCAHWACNTAPAMRRATLQYLGCPLIFVSKRI
jgi:hypothetical protein